MGQYTCINFVDNLKHDQVLYCYNMDIRTLIQYNHSFIFSLFNSAHPTQLTLEMRWRRGFAKDRNVMKIQVVQIVLPLAFSVKHVIDHTGNILEQRFTVLLL